MNIIPIAVITGIFHNGLNKSLHLELTSESFSMSFLMEEATEAADAPSVFPRTSNASFSRPTDISHLGLSGRKIIPTNRINAGITPT